jgi:molybdopterin converting factor small subunit
MQEPFEKNIEQQLKSFTLQPNETVWQEVEQALHSKKKRFLPFWFFGIIGLFMLGIATKLFYTANTTASKKVQIAEKKIANNEQKNTVENLTESFLKQQQNLNETKKFDVNNKKASSNILVNSIQTKSVDTNKKLSTNSSTQFITKQVHVNSDNNYLTNVIEDKTDAKNKSSSYAIHDVTSKFEQQALINVHLQLNDLNQLKTIDQLTLTDNHFPLVKDFPKKQPSKKEWFVQINGGVFQPQQNLFSKSTAADFASGSSLIVANNTTSKSIEMPNGIAIGIGTGFNKTINKKWNYSIGIQYQYYGNKQQLSADSALSTPNNGIQNYVNYYPSGTTKNVNNQAHLLTVPINFNFSINPNAINQWQLQAGISGSLAIYNNWLIANVTTGKYYYDRSLNNLFIGNIQAGIIFNHNNQYGISLIAQRSLTPIHKQVNNVYFSQLSLQLTKYLSSKK